MDNELKKKVLREVSCLFEISPPKDIRKSLCRVFFAFVIREENYLEDDFKQIVSDFQVLVDYMERMEDLDGKNFYEKGIFK